MTKSERLRQRRETTAKAERDASRRRAWLTFLSVGLPATATVILLIVGTVDRAGQPADDPVESLTGVATYEVASAEHVQGPVDYPQMPPIGGPHAPVWQNCGFYSEPVPSETAVHSMEHGAVWITYDPALPAGDIAALRDLSQQQSFVLTTPLHGLDAPVVASAWGRQLDVTGAEDPQLAAFVHAFRTGPQTPEPGAPCTGGLGEPTA